MSGLTPRGADELLEAILAAIAFGLLVACLMAIIYTSWWAPVLGGTGWLLIELRHRLIDAGELEL